MSAQSPQSKARYVPDSKVTANPPSDARIAFIPADGDEGDEDYTTVADLGTGGGGLTTLTVTYNGSAPFDVRAVTPLGYDPAVGGTVAFIASSLPFFAFDFGMFFVVATVNASGVITTALMSSPVTQAAYDGARNSAPFTVDAEQLTLTGGSGGVLTFDLPPSDPLVAGQLWNDSGTVKISAG